MTDRTADNNATNNFENTSTYPPQWVGNDVDDILKDPVKQAEVMQKLGVPDPSVLIPLVRRL